jgi:prevent-host-death family protein
LSQPAFNILVSGGESNAVSTWTLAEARARLDEVIDRAQSDCPQTITQDGRAAVIIVSAEEWERKTRATGNLAEFFAASPTRGSGLKLERLKGYPHEIDW